MSADDYPLEPFRCVEPDKLHAIVRAYPLATMISHGEPWPIISQVPLLLDADRGAHGFLRGHFDGNNPHGAALRSDPRVTCLFSGPSHYISPSIYPTQQYPGWNYFTVHIHALARRLTDRERVREILFDLAARHEPASSGYVLASTQPNFERFLDQIFGFELEIVEARAILKLAQDKGRDHAELAAVHLAAQPQQDLLELLMRLLA